MFELKLFERKQVSNHGGRCKESYELFPVHGNRVEIVPMASLNGIGDGKQYIPSHKTWFSALEMIGRVETKEKS